MADINNKPGKKPHPALFVGIIVVVLAVLGSVMYLSKSKPEAPAETPTATEQTTEQTLATAASAEKATIDVNEALSDRILGSTSAPVKISEHASLTCSHCGDFHRETFDKLKKEYIDTGKVYLVFSDFPLNAPAVQAAMVARCLPKDKYFDFIHMLFETQKDWAFDANYLDYLKTKAAANGLDEAHFQACIENTELQNGIVNRMKGIQQQWNINSTPSFVINNRTTISGAYPYEEFKKIIDTELSGKKSDAPSSAGQSETSENPATTPAKESREAAPAATPDQAPAASEEKPAEETPAGAESEETPEPDAAPSADQQSEAQSASPAPTPEAAPAPVAPSGSATGSEGTTKAQ